MTEKPACPACKTLSWSAETIHLQGVEKAIFICGGCGGFFLSKPEEMPYWDRLANRLVAPQPQSNSFGMNPEFYRVSQKPK